MKISIIAPVLSGKGGTETVINKVLNSDSLKQSQISTTLFLAGGTYSLEWLKNTSANRLISITEKNKLLKLLRFIQYLLHTDDQLLLILSTKLIVLAYWIKKIFNRKYTIISWIHFSLNDEPEVHTKDLHYADAHFAISSGIREQLLALGIPDNNIYTVYNPVSPNQNIIPQAEQAKFVFIGRILFDGQKNLKELIDGLAQVKLNNWQITMIGTGPDLQKCQNYIAEKYPNLIQSFIWKGWVDDPWTIIDEASLLLLTSKFEGFPMVLLEAISRGLPCLSSDCPTGPADIIQPAINGDLYQMGNLQEFSSKISYLLDEVHFESKTVKSSIEKFYDQSYEKNILKALNEVKIDHVKK
ncbi:glycosyltransferase [Loigolactobacillus zhaoyuanensis]|uniref:Glycosyltransferase n=1 Tax=Loigolactobacillus zhaoyuanensis TaxID=2486017 RepID=A0ABW8UE43_9LACO